MSGKSAHDIMSKDNCDERNSCDSEDDDTQLPADTLAILNEFLQERDACSSENGPDGKSAVKIEENWVL